MRNYKLLLPTLLTACLLLLTTENTTAQSRRSKKQNTTKINPELHESIQYRSIGPFRGGRSAAAVGVPNQPKVFYFGATGGGGATSGLRRLFFNPVNSSIDNAPA